ncbi:unnamed protein product [Boreogadus saida]
MVVLCDMKMKSRLNRDMEEKGIVARDCLPTEPRCLLPRLPPLKPHVRSRRRGQCPQGSQRRDQERTNRITRNTRATGLHGSPRSLTTDAWPTPNPPAANQTATESLEWSLNTSQLENNNELYSDTDCIQDVNGLKNI